MYRTLQKPDATGNIVLNDRDIIWIRAAHRFRFLTTDQAELLSGSSRHKVNRRLQKLWAFDYLDRPQVQLEAYSYQNKRHTVHALGQRGAAWLAENDGVSFPKGKGWRTANRLKSTERLTHQIGVVDTVLRLERAAAATDHLTLTHHDEILENLTWPTGLKAHRLPTKVRQQGVMVDRGTDPDYTFLISRRVGDKAQHGLCFLEWDNASESFIKANRLASSIAQKHLCYAYAYRQGLHRDLYGRNNFRVLFVVNGDEHRVDKMREVCERVVTDVPKGIFWYTTHAILEAEGPLGDIWVNGDGKRLALA